MNIAQRLLAFIVDRNTAGRENRGELRLEPGTPDQLFLGRLDAGGSMEWTQISDQGGGGGGGGAISAVGDTASIDLTLSAGTLTADAIFGSTSTTVAAGNHTHAGVYANATHAHAESDITGLVSDLAGKAATVHTHAQADVTGLVTALAGKAASSHTHAISDITQIAPVITLGPFYINDLLGTTTIQATLGYFNTAALLSRSANDIKMDRAGAVIGLIVTSDAARTAGTATIRVRINGTGTTFNAGSVVLNATNTTSASSFVSVAGGLAFTAGQTLGADAVTSGWTPITADLSVWLVVQLSAY